jgi:DNA-binding Xre family transcriptional regulator
MCQAFQCDVAEWYNFRKGWFFAQVRRKNSFAGEYNAPLSVAKLSEFLSLQRDFGNISMAQISNHCGMSARFLWQIDGQAVETVSQNTVFKICKGFFMTPKEIDAFCKAYTYRKNFIEEHISLQKAASFFRSRRLDAFLSFEDIRQRSGLTMRMMSDLENERDMLKLGFVVGQLCQIFECSFKDIAAHQCEDEITLSVRDLQEFVRFQMGQKEMTIHGLSKAANLSFSGLQNFALNETPNYFSMNTLRALCDVFECSPRDIAEFRKRGNIGQETSFPTP